MSELTHRKRIGDYLIERGLIRQESVEVILKICEEKKLRFGEAAMELGLIREDQLREALAYPYKKELFIHLNPNYFPKETKSLLNLDLILELGILPLGFKTKWKFFRKKRVLNIVHVGAKPSLESLQWVQANQEEVQFFHALPHEFLKVLEIQYGFSPTNVRNLDQKIHGALRRILEATEDRRRSTGTRRGTDL